MVFYLSLGYTQGLYEVVLTNDVLFFWKTTQLSQKALPIKLQGIFDLLRWHSTLQGLRLDLR